MKMINLLTFFCLILPILTLIKCPDGKSACPDGTTCCPLSEEIYGCCPIQDAVCCQDDRHCCPKDTVCDTSEGRCIHHLTGHRLPMHKKTVSVKIDDDSSDEFEIFVKDKVDDSESSENMQLKTPEVNSPRRNAFRSNQVNPVGDVTCSDGKSKCPSGSTCCDLGEQIFGCCPVPDAVCCDDKIHCCPEGMKCDVAEGRCLNSETLETSPWYKKFRATRIVRKNAIELEPTSRECGGGSCQGDETCCSRTFAMTPKCCPFSNGICCLDATCCPKGYRCGKGGCYASTEGLIVTAPRGLLRTGEPEQPESEDDLPSVTCPDGTKCRARAKCCTVQNDRRQNSYKCCSLPGGTCCESSCCPRGFHCVSGGFCERSAFTKELVKELFFDSL